jgi:hypothetical protein
MLTTAPDAAPTSFTVHAPTCPKVALSGTRDAREVRESHPYAFTHDCLPGGFTGRTVRLTVTHHRTHAYEPSMIDPAGSPRPLCLVCRTLHDA